jgi:hypothetical protein
MAFCITITKMHESSDQVVYVFEDGGKRGRLHLDKKTGQATIIDSATPAIDTRAAMKLRQHWEAGEFPERANWQS